MKRSSVLRQDRESLLLACQRMTPQERLVAYANHARLVYQLYQAGVKHRSRKR